MHKVNFIRQAESKICVAILEIIGKCK